MESKYLIFFIGMALFIPVGISLCCQSKKASSLVFIMLIFGTTQPDTLFGLPSDINFLSREWYRGSTRGIEISYLDLLTIILLFSSRFWRQREGIPPYTPQGYNYLKVYFLWGLITVFLVSEPKIFGVFELTKMYRGILIFLAISAFIRSTDQLRLFIYVVLGIAFYEAIIALYQRYMLGIHRVRATQPHPNSLSMYNLQILPIVLSLWFAKDLSKKLRILSLLASLLIAVTIILTISRTGFAALAILTLLTLFLNIRGRLNGSNLLFLFTVMTIGTLMTFKAWDSLSSRYTTFDLNNEYLTKEGDRGSYFYQGLPALADNPIFGIGLNNWSYWISNKYAKETGYQSATYPSIDHAPPTNLQKPPAHNLYLLTAVELGVFGLVLLLALFKRWLYISSYRLKIRKGNFTDQLRIGLFLSLIGVLLQSVTEWEVRQTSLYFFMHIVASVSAYIYHYRFNQNLKKLRTLTTKNISL